MKRWQQLCSALILAGTASAVPAAIYSNGTATATFTVSLTLQANCTITANPLAFGSTGVLTAAINQQTTVAVTCTNTTPYNVGMDAGGVAGSTVGTRLMSGITVGNTGTVNFQLYQDSGHSTVWGNTQGTDTASGTGTGSAQSINVYGQVPSQPTPRADSYQSTVTATVYF
ncbi:Csu type fimbrial protein [Dyella sp. 2RAB6]|uniref:Csu type fimbrial protein n=1 Tax=Dyella sp. 2RAB6 TaxID=3232992 RepID=UPI003F8E2AC7